MLAPLRNGVSVKTQEEGPVKTLRVGVLLRGSGYPFSVSYATESGPPVNPTQVQNLDKIDCAGQINQGNLRRDAVPKTLSTMRSIFNGRKLSGQFVTPPPYDVSATRFYPWAGVSAQLLRKPQDGWSWLADGNRSQL